MNEVEIKALQKHWAKMTTSLRDGDIVDELIQDSILSQNSFEIIRAEKTPTDRVRKLLTSVIACPNKNTFDSFLKALRGVEGGMFAPLADSIRQCKNDLLQEDERNKNIERMRQKRVSGGENRGQKIDHVIYMRGLSCKDCQALKPDKDTTDGYRIDHIPAGTKWTRLGSLRPGDVIKKVQGKKCHQLMWEKCCGLFCKPPDQISSMTVRRPKFIKMRVTLKRDPNKGFGLCLGYRAVTPRFPPGGGVYIVGIAPGSPAQRGDHLAVGDRVIRIDEESTEGLSWEDIVSRLSGKSVDIVDITIQRQEYSICFCV